MCRPVEVVVSLWRDREALRRGKLFSEIRVHLSRRLAIRPTRLARRFAARRDAITSAPWPAARPRPD